MGKRGYARLWDSLGQETDPGQGAGGGGKRGENPIREGEGLL